MNWLSNNFIIKPLIWMIKLLPIPEKRVKIVEKWHLIPQNNPDKNGDAHLAYRWMLWSLTWVLILMLTPLKTHLGLNLIAILVVASLASIIFNETILCRKAKYENHFKKEVDYSKIRGQHNIFRYQKAKKIIILIDKKTTKEKLEIVLLSCQTINSPFIILSNDEPDISNHKSINENSFQNILHDIDEDTIIRSLVEILPEKFMKECHKKNIHVYNQIPHTNGRLELLNYFTEQSLSINFHRYGNLMGETNV